MKIYVLSLKNSTRRNKFSQDNFFLDGLYTFFDAVEGKLLTDNYIHNINKSTNRYNRSIGRNEIACADSHIAIYQNMIEKKIEWAIIFEDDVQIDKRLLDLIKYKKNELETSNVYILGGQDGLPSREMIVTSKKNRISISNGIEFEKTSASSKYIYRTCCYLIHRELAQNILEQRKRYFFLADDWHFLYKRKIVKSFYITNCVTHPIDLNNSVIQNERTACKKNNFIQKIKNGKLRKYKIALRRIIYG